MEKPVTRVELELLAAEKAAECQNPHCSGAHMLTVVCYRCDGNQRVIATYIDGVLTLTCPLCDQVADRFLIAVE